MNVKKALVFGLVTVSLLSVIAVYAKKESVNNGRKPVDLEDYNRKTEVNILTMDLHNRVEKEGMKVLENLSGFELPTDPLTKKQFLDFVGKRKKLWNLHAQVSPAYEQAQILAQTDKKGAIKLYDDALNIFKKGKATISESENMYVYMDMANINKEKGNIYKELKDKNNQESSLKDVVSNYDQAIVAYKKNPKQYDAENDPDLHIGKGLQYEKGQNLEVLASIAVTKTEKKKLLLQALESYKEILKYNTKDNCDIGCVIVNSENIRNIYTQLKNL